ncbi:hypothetical protein E2C01_017633 [Portunus trituberculatus]|uniref:Uncharacterized protein n=1 Tax=Portunus trituberculatus TaxID=210409 RepID=A0A5B7DSZ9_PORTR|nr:hypothetical protein [Portunus trituberculatus]
MGHLWYPPQNEIPRLVSESPSLNFNSLLAFPRQFFSWTSDQFGQCYTFNSALRKITHNGKTFLARVKATTSTGPMLPFPEEEGFNVSPGVSVSVSMSRRCKKVCLEEEYWRECDCYVGKSPVYHQDKQHVLRPEIACSPFNMRHSE